MSETHLFDFGLDRVFNNFEIQDPAPQLASFVTREQLVDLARDLCDGVLMRMREQTKPSARFVVEKTPLHLTNIAEGRPELEIERKLECYPDAWYIHIAREPSAAGSSLARAPWAPFRSGHEELIRRGAAAVRTMLSGHERYREVSYEALREDPADVAAELFAWLGLEHHEQIRERVRLVSIERYAAVPTDGRPRRTSVRSMLPRGLRRSAGIARRALVGGRRAEGGASASHSTERMLLERFARSLMSADQAELREITEEGLVLRVRSASGSMHAEGDRARAALLFLSEDLFQDPFITRGWALAMGEPFHSLVFTGMTAGGEQADVSISVITSGERISWILLISAGAPARRPLAEWKPGDEPATMS